MEKTKFQAWAVQMHDKKIQKPIVLKILFQTNLIMPQQKKQKFECERSLELLLVLLYVEPLLSVPHMVMPRVIIT